MTVEYQNSHGRSFLDPNLHLMALESLAGQALRERKFERAFALADRRCRLRPVAEASHFLMRAAALTHLGERELAYQDVRHALEIEPENIIAHRSLLASTSREERIRAASILVRLDNRPIVLKEAIAALNAPQIAGIGALKAGIRGIRGWLAWKQHSPLTLRLRWPGGEAAARVIPDSSHPLMSSLGSAADWSTDWPEGADYVEVLPQPDQFLLFEPMLLRPRAEPPVRIPAPTDCRVQAVGAARKVVVILPVYDDYDATRVCLETLLADTSSIDRQIIAIDDASPDPRISRLLVTAAESGSIRLLRHENNLGFARSVNDAIELLTDEDVLLLNADTVLPRGFLERLAQAAHAADDIGTATPFSNNGEYTSYPVPFRENQLPSLADITAIDRTMARVNAGGVIDMPNGTGFCMYVTRACLDRIGPLSVRFGRGYFEDVDFCLRAAAAGFRNVCAADVFVGHAGSRSFKTGKRALVVRNLSTIEDRFPGYRETSAAFMAADPLRPARESIERTALKEIGGGCLLIVGEATDTESVQDRTRDLVADNERVVVATASLVAGRVIVRFQAAADGLPQSIRIDCAMEDAAQELLRNLDLLAVTRIEFGDLPSIPTAVVRAVRQLKIPYDLHVRDPGFMCALRASDPDFAASCAICHGDCPCGRDEPVFGCEESGGQSGARRDLWLSTISAAGRMIAANSEVASIITACFGEAGPSITIAPTPAEPDDRVPIARSVRNSTCLGIVVTDRRVANFRFLTELLHQLATADRAGIVVFGSTLDDLRAMAVGNVFVTGLVEPVELPGLIRRHGVSHLFFPDRRGAHASPHWRAVKRNGLPIACFDWSACTAATPANGYLAFSPIAATSAIVHALQRWLLDAQDVGHG